jgi:phosphopentomutase
MNNFILIVLDGVGVGELPDAVEYGDSGSNTLKNISLRLGKLYLPNFQRLGLGNIIDIQGVAKNPFPLASFGKLAEVSKGKDSTTGHWELAGIKVDKDFDYFPEGFPKEIIENFKILTGCQGILGNKPASGTEIIKELGEEHCRTGFPIIYTSADSVFQIAAHEEIFGLERLYKICEITRKEVLKPPINVARVIARPFIGNNNNFTRTSNRKDYSIDPPSETLIDILKINGVNTIAIGKVADLFNNRGFNVIEKTKSNSEGIKALFEYTQLVSSSFIFANLVDFDVYYGHRNDVEGFYRALQEFDESIPYLLNNLSPDDRLIITADHGNDPTTLSTDHSREYVPLLYYGKNKRAFSLGIRKTFSDVAKTVSDYYKLKTSFPGTSFLNM